MGDQVWRDDRWSVGRARGLRTVGGWLAVGATCALMAACSPGAENSAAAAATVAAAPADADAENIRLIGYNDMQGRAALQVTTKSDAANGKWVYLGNMASGGTSEGPFNPITKQHEWNGTSILEISDPAHPKYVW